MTEFFTAGEMKELLVAGLKIQLRTARLAFNASPHDEGAPAAGRLGARDLIRDGICLLREVQDLPEDDPRIVRLAELMPTAEALLAVISGENGIRSASADLYLNALVDCAEMAAGS